MISNKIWVAATVSLYVAAAAQLQAQTTLGAVSGKVGTLGIGAEYNHPYSDNIDISMGINGGSYGYSTTEDGVDYDAKLKLFTVEALADYYPNRANGFKITGGLVYNGNKITLDAKPRNGTYSFNNVTYDANDIGSANSKVDFNKIAPYIGIGWTSNANRKGWGFDSDLGILYQGSPDVSLDITCGSSISDAQCTQIKADGESERKSLENDLSSAKIYPVLSIGARYNY